MLCGCSILGATLMNNILRIIALALLLMQIAIFGVLILEATNEKQAVMPGYERVTDVDSKK